MLPECPNNRRTKTSAFTCVLVIGVLMGMLTSALAEHSPRHSPQTHLIIACDKSEKGLVVNFSQSSSLHKYDGNPNTRESCLQLLAQFPKRSRRTLPAFFSAHPRTGSSIDPSIEEKLIWIQKHRRVPKNIVGCDLDEEGILRTEFVNGQTVIPNERCVDTLATLEGPRHNTTGPFAAHFGQNAEGNFKGGLLWVIHRRRSVEVVECNLDTSGNLVTTYRESTMEGIMPNGQSCLAVLFEQRGPGRFTIQGPVPIPADDGGDDDVDLPDCIIWDIDGAT